MKRMWMAGVFLMVLCAVVVWATVEERQAALETVSLKHRALSGESNQRQPELAKELRRTIEAVRSTAAYLVLKRQALTALGAI